MTLVRDYLTVVGLIAGTLAAVFAVAKTPVGRAGRWMTRQLIVAPFSRWFRGEVADVVAPLIDQAITDRLMKPNGGSSLHDIGRRIGNLEKHLTRQDIDHADESAPKEPT